MLFKIYSNEETQAGWSREGQKTITIERRFLVESFRGKRPVGRPRSRREGNAQKVALSVLHVQNWKSAVQSKQTWRKKTGEVMTRIRAETPKKRRAERRGEKTEKYPYNSDLKGISYRMLTGAGFFLISKWRNTKKFSQLYQLLPVRCLTTTSLSPLVACPNKPSVTLIFLEAAVVRMTLDRISHCLPY
jgi:hypothetical protein